MFKHLLVLTSFVAGVDYPEISLVVQVIILCRLERMFHIAAHIIAHDSTPFSTAPHRPEATTSIVLDALLALVDRVKDC